MYVSCLFVQHIGLYSDQKVASPAFLQISQWTAIHLIRLTHFLSALIQKAAELRALSG